MEEEENISLNWLKDVRLPKQFKFTMMAWLLTIELVLIALIVAMIEEGLRGFSVDQYFVINIFEMFAFGTGFLVGIVFKHKGIV